MHFTTLFILKGEKLENINHSIIEDLFSDRYCYNCGETRPRYRYWCDWFQIGGRWCDMLKADRGIHCTRGYPNVGVPVNEGEFSVVQISELKEPIDKKDIYAVATKSRLYEEGEEDYDRLIDAVNNKKFDGVIALIDCHD